MEDLVGQTAEQTWDWNVLNITITNLLAQERSSCKTTIAENRQQISQVTSISWCKEMQSVYGN